MQKKSTIKDISRVILGFTFRTTLREKEDGNISVILAKNITDEISINSEALINIELDKIRSNALAKNNDVVISSRGNFKSAVLRSGEMPVVASSSTYLLRLKTKDILSEYLSIYLNSRYGQSQIKAKTIGAVISSLSKRDLEEIEVIIPTIEKQKKIVEIYKNNLRLQKVLKQKQFLTDKINKGIINQLISQ